MVKVDIISGFLGAGKTTIIKKLLVKKPVTEKLVIIENEFGEIGIDGGILKNSKTEVREINSGCICCTLVGDFEKAIEEVIAKYRPDRIIIEPSGVAKLSEVIKACESPKLKELIKVSMLIAVVDAMKYQIYISNFGEFFENQVRHAATIILSRTQKIENKKLEEVVNSIRKLNDKANIITTPWDNIDTKRIISVAERELPVSLENELKGFGKKAIHQMGCECGGSHEYPHSHSADEAFDVWGIETPKKYNEAELKNILGLLAKEKPYGMILRGKGILQLTEDRWLQFDYTPGELEMRETSADYTGRVCIIGRDLKKTELAKLFGVPA